MFSVTVVVWLEFVNLLCKGYEVKSNFLLLLLYAFIDTVCWAKITAAGVDNDFAVIIITEVYEEWSQLLLLLCAAFLIPVVYVSNWKYVFHGSKLMCKINA